MSTGWAPGMQTPRLTNVGLDQSVEGPERPIRDLAFGILLEALRDLPDLTKRSSREGSENWKEDAREWIFSEETDPGSLYWVCGVLNISSVALREELRLLQCADRKCREELIEKLSRFQIHC